MHGQLSLAFMSTPLPIEYASLGMADSLILMVLALVVFGPRRLPQIGRQIGKLMYEFRKASNDFKFQMEEELRNAEEADRRKKEEERQRALAAQQASEQASVSAPALPPVNAVESPYPGEGTYPPSTPEPPAVSAPAEEAAPRISPPSTGTTVAAGPPSPAVSSSDRTVGKTGSEALPEAAQESAQPQDPHPQTGQQRDTSPEVLNQHG